MSGAAACRREEPEDPAFAQNHCPGSMNPRSKSWRECQANGVGRRHRKVSMARDEAGLRLGALAARNEHKAAVGLLCQGQA